MPGWWYLEGRASARSGNGPGRTGVEARLATEGAERGGAIEEALRGGRLLKTIPHRVLSQWQRKFAFSLLNSSPARCFLHAAATAFKLKCSICSFISWVKLAAPAPFTTR